jgi:hypothetical protein
MQSSVQSLKSHRKGKRTSASMVSSFNRINYGNEMTLIYSSSTALFLLK